MYRSSGVAVLASQLNTLDSVTPIRTATSFWSIFQNHGPGAGTSLVHAHSQLIATPVTPSVIRVRLQTAMRHYDDTGHPAYIDDCAECEHQRAESHGFTRCPNCGREFSGDRPEYLAHNPPYCMRGEIHPTGIDWTVLWGQRVTIDNRWLYHGDRAEYAGEFTGVVRSGALIGDTHVPYLEMVDDQGEGEAIPFCPRQWTIRLHQDDDEPTVFEPQPGPRLLGQLPALPDRLRTGPKAAEYRVLRTETGWSCYAYQTGEWLAAADAPAGGELPDWWQLVPGLEYRLRVNDAGDWSVSSLTETPCDFPDPSRSQGVDTLGCRPFPKPQVTTASPNTTRPALGRPRPSEGVAHQRACALTTPRTPGTAVRCPRGGT